MTVRIKRLELHGFKSFPRSTVFEFDAGITAIIGPNGSGKSNIADAVRWVLGEQSYSNLRGRKAEDVIFSGSSARAAVGMAEAALVLDNTGGELPIEFQEVSITRRAYRSGENQYLINGARVRLKDVTHITSTLGQAHTVIGQGLVDAALSQRPEERRGLFEHAAGITGLRMKYSATARHLTETTANSTRLEDLLTELEPRLRTLERQAKQAREYAAVQQNLRETALRYYASLWREHQNRLQSLKQDVSESDAALRDTTNGLECARETIQQLTDELEALQRRSDALEERLTGQHSHQRELEHQIALSRQRRESLNNEIERYDERRSSLDAELANIRLLIADRQEEQDAIQVQLGEIDEQLGRQQSERAALDDQIQALSGRQDAIDAERESLRQRIYQSQAEHDYRRQQQEDLRARTESFARRRADLEAEITEVEQALAQSVSAHSSLEKARQERSREISGLESSLSALRAQSRRLREELDGFDSERTTRAARLDALERVQESGEGLHRGAQTVLESARSGTLQGVIGALAAQITVPEHLESAIEAALGGHLQDIVVHRWADAEAAIALLKNQNAGRATFQPLDTQRRPDNRNRPSIHGEPGVHGVAVDLIDFKAELEPVLDGLLGRTVITDDLPSTRKILGKLRAGWTAVTLEGEVSRSAGSVTGGSRVRQSGTLSRERELRDLPGEIERIDVRRAELRAELGKAAKTDAEQETRLEQARSELRTLEGQIDASDREQAALQQRLEQARGNLVRLDSETGVATAEAGARSSEIDQLAERRQHDSDVLSRLDQQRAETAARISELQTAADDETLRHLDSERSRLGERLQSLTHQARELSDRQQRIERDNARADADRSSTRQTIEQLDLELIDLQSQVERARRDIESLSGDLEPIAEQQATLKRRRNEQERHFQQLQSQQRDIERRRDSQQFDIERETSQGSHLVERLADILESEDPLPLLRRQPAEEDLDHHKLETELHRLRQRSRRIGAFGEDTIAQYEQEQERFTFLRGQLDDVQRGAEALQSMLQDLEKAMSREFDRTFGDVARAFQGTFQRLFGGGSAELVRNDDETDAGIDIVAQPPGKRLQSLALLSGGERALTAVALLFAIQRVNPSPFCLLDEVDAALDESNVVRFRDELRDLSANTQFVVVTHNRSTIEGADVLYGVTMGDDAISRVVSMRLPEEAPVT